MARNNEELTEQDHVNLDAFLGHILDDYKNAFIGKEQAIGGIAHVVAALDIGNYDEVRSWLEQGRKFVRNGQR